ncbi:MAG TPA: ATP-binding cassette domain-containing protein [Conexibacter sp.]
MSEIRFDHTTKAFEGGVRNAVNDLSLEIRDGEFMVLVGPSGCGKTTALRMVAGLETPTSGAIRIDGQVVNDLEPKDRDIAMVFQSYALYPHMTVAQNMAFSLKLAKVAREERDRRVADAAQMLHLTELLQRKLAALCGGQRQRVAMGRAIVRHPRAFLMDEPLSNLDAKLRVDMRAYLQELRTRLGVTTLYVTHDQVEAMTLGDRVAVMRDGHLQQVAPPQELFQSPANVFVATFMGSPTMNMTRAAVVKDDGIALVAGGIRLPLPERLAALVADRVGGEVIMGLRPSAFTWRDGNGDGPGADDGIAVSAPAAVVEALGTSMNAFFRVEAPPLSTASVQTDVPDGADGSSLWVATLPPRVGVQPGDVLKLSADPELLYLFDPETEEAL